MPKAEFGTTKQLNNQLKSKGLQRLRWYCQVCEKQCRDENGFKMHTQSESHVRNMLLVGEDSKKFIQNYSAQFQRDFLLLLRTSHGEKRVHLNHFYQEYISNKEHIHMNSTKWPSLIEFGKFLGREGICRVDEDEKGIYIAWVDNSPENLRRQDAVRKRERQDRGDEERENRAIREQIRKAREERGSADEEDGEEERELKRGEEGEKIKLNFGGKAVTKVDDLEKGKGKETDTVMAGGELPVSASELTKEGEKPSEEAIPTSEETPALDSASTPATAPAKVAMKLGFSSKPKNVFAAAKKNVLGGKKAVGIEQPKKMSEAERIMREEMDRKKRGPSGFGGPAQKKQKF